MSVTRPAAAALVSAALAHRVALPPPTSTGAAGPELLAMVLAPGCPPEVAGAGLLPVASLEIVRWVVSGAGALAVARLLQTWADCCAGDPIMAPVVSPEPHVAPATAVGQLAQHARWWHSAGEVIEAVGGVAWTTAQLQGALFPGQPFPAQAAVALDALTTAVELCAATHGEPNAPFLTAYCALPPPVPDDSAPDDETLLDDAAATGPTEPAAMTVPRIRAVQQQRVAAERQALREGTLRGIVARHVAHDPSKDRVLLLHRVVYCASVLNTVARAAVSSLRVEYCRLYARAAEVIQARWRLHRALRQQATTVAAMTVAARARHEHRCRPIVDALRRHLAARAERCAMALVEGDPPVPPLALHVVGRYMLELCPRCTEVADAAVLTLHPEAMDALGTIVV